MREKGLYAFRSAEQCSTKFFMVRIMCTLRYTMFATSVSFESKHLEQHNYKFKGYVTRDSSQGRF